MPSKSTISAPRTALRLDQALNLIPGQIGSLEDRGEGYYPFDIEPDEEGPGRDPNQAIELADCEFLERLAESRFVPASLTLQDTKRIDEAVKRVPFHLARAQWAGDGLFFQSLGHRENLWTQVEEELRETRERTVEFSYSDAFARVADEAVLYHLLNPEPEIRRCAFCTKWFEAEYRGRARFCGTDCRKRFANVCQTWPTFQCVLGDHCIGLNEFSGLSLTSAAAAEVSPVHAATGRDRLSMSGVGWIAEHVDQNGLEPDFELPSYWACARCVYKDYPQWRTYVAPIMALHKRGRVS